MDELKTWLEELTGKECTELLGRSWLGRLGVVVDGHPEIFPVNHAFDPMTGDIAFPTRVGLMMRSAMASPHVAFEVDGVDQATHSGWSVMVIGHAVEITDPHEIGRMRQLRLARWAISERSHWLRIRPERITGRRISLSR